MLGVGNVANPMMLSIALVTTYLINIVFGYWRVFTKIINSRKEWFLAVHALVPFVFLLRIWSNSGLSLIPIFVLAFFLGQYTGGFIHKRIAVLKGRTSRLIFKDLILEKY